MREIKFRLRLDNKIVGYERWYSGERSPDENRPKERYWRSNPCWLYSEDGKYWTPTPIFHNHKDQFTGLKDKNGKEIYEGDIVNPSLRVVSIEDPFIKELADGDIITQGMGVYTLCFNPEYPRTKFSFGRTQAQSSEVIGNTYENKELLKEGGK